MLTITSILAKNYPSWINLPDTTLVNTLLNQYTSVLIDISDSTNTPLGQFNIRNLIGINDVPNTVTISNFIANYSYILINEITTPKSLLNKKRILCMQPWWKNVNIDAGNMRLQAVNVSGNNDDVVVHFNQPNTLTMNDYHNYFLMTINGLIFFETILGNYAYLPNGMKYVCKEELQGFSLLDFSAVSPITKTVIESNHITISHKTVVGCTVTLTMPTAFTSTAFFLVLNGRLKYAKSDTYIINSNSISFPLLYSEMSKEATGIDSLDRGWIPAADGYGKGYNCSAINVINYLTNGMTGIISLSVKDLCYDLLPCLRTDLKGTYRLPYGIATNGFLVLSDGRLAEYNAVQKTGYGTVLNTTNTKYNRAATRTQPINKIKVDLLANYDYKSDYTMGRYIDFYVL